MNEKISFLSSVNMRNEILQRLSPYIKEKIPTSRKPEFEADDWVLDKQLKSQVWMRKIKRHDVAFEDQVWAMCARLGFDLLSNGRRVEIRYGKGDEEFRAATMIAADDEVALIIECRSSAASQAPSLTFKSEIDDIDKNRTALIGALRTYLPGRKIRFVVATNNINVSKDALERISNSDIAYIDEEAISYYHELANHLGVAAKFQLLGNLFKGQQISAMDSAVPAIQGKMGGHLYYSFAIEPERLLKIAYVLHRNNTNKRWMPSYQRIIKKTRLKKVSTFVENGGFFPNSLVINIDNNGKKLKFDRTDRQIGATTLGILHLPRKYRSAYVVDGQHRLYGFANSDRASTELVPVVAFVDLPGEKQVELFMQINENQQSVPKNLQNTLNADLDWTSQDKKKQDQALKLKVALLLGEQKSSPLRGRVIMGEEQSSDRQCISLDAIKRGIDRGRYVGEYVRDGVKRFGSFYRTSNDDTYEPLVDFLELCFGYLRDKLPRQWNIGRGEGGFVFTNAGVEAILRLVGDIVDHQKNNGRVDPRESSPEEVFVEVEKLLAPFVNYVVGLSAEQSAEFRGWLGSGGPTKYLRRFQVAIAGSVSDFEPEGLVEWVKEQEKQFNTESYTMVHAIEAHLNSDIRKRLEDKFGSNWFRQGIPQKVYQAAQALAAQKQYEALPGVQVDWWDCLFLINYRDIFLHGNMALWNEIYDDVYTLPSDRKASSWKDKSLWLLKLNDIRRKVSHNGSVLEEEFEFLRLMHSHFELGNS